jgi:hypothetical protein
VAWEIGDIVNNRTATTLVLRETAGVGIQFTNVLVDEALPPTGWGREWYGGGWEVVFRQRLGANAELTIPITAPFPRGAPYTDYEFRGVDDTGKPVRVKVRVPWR